MTLDLAKLEALMEKATPTHAEMMKHSGAYMVKPWIAFAAILETDIAAMKNALPDLLDAARDAERYRWLRDKAHEVKDCSVMLDLDAEHFAEGKEDGPYIDAAIDAAMKEGK